MVHPIYFRSDLPGYLCKKCHPFTEGHIAILDILVSLSPLQKKSLGQMMFDQVLRRLEVLERDYFGLQFEDEQKTEVRESVCSTV